MRSTVYCLIIDDKYNVHHAYPLCVEERLDYYEHMWDNDDEDNKMLSALGLGYTLLILVFSQNFSWLFINFCEVMEVLMKFWHWHFHSVAGKQPKL